MVRQRENKTPAPCSKQFVVHFFVAKSVASNETTKHFGVKSPINATVNKKTKHFRCLGHFPLSFRQQVNVLPSGPLFVGKRFFLTETNW